MPESDTPRPIPASGAPELPVRAVADALEAGASIDAVAAMVGMTPVALVCAGVQVLAAHPDEFSNAEHLRICTLLASALDPSS